MTPLKKKMKSQNKIIKTPKNPLFLQQVTETVILTLNSLKQRKIFLRILRKRQETQIMEVQMDMKNILRRLGKIMLKEKMQKDMSFWIMLVRRN